MDLVAVFGENEARDILSTIRMITLRNATGIPPSSLLGRLRGRADPGSSLGYEVGTILGSAVVMPCGLLCRALADLRGEPIITFQT